MIDPLADHVTLEFEAHIQCLFVDQPQRGFAINRDDDARAVIANRILDAITDAMPEMLNAAVSYPLRSNGTATHARGEASSIGDLP